ncbi:MAG: hypothetical protein Q9217_005737 [Psora testacea]
MFHKPADRIWAIDSFTSHLHSRALPLLDLSLYVCSHNYTTLTRPAYSQFLPWPAPYTIPPARRALAKSRTSHLALSAQDLDQIDTEDTEEQLEKEGHASLIPERFRTPRKIQTITSLVKKQRTTSRFKLDALVDNLCSPLAKLLDEKKYLLSNTHVSSLDCLALGYLSLALIPKVPQAWLREGIQARYPNLCAFVDRMITYERVFGGCAVTVEAALSPSTSSSTSDAVINAKGDGGLPWQPPQPRTMAARITTTFLSSTVDGLPFSQAKILPVHPTTPSPSSSSSSPDKVVPHQLPTTYLPRLLLPIATAMAAAVGTYAFYPTLMGLSSKTEKDTARRRLEDMGEAGSMLAGLDFRLDSGEGGTLLNGSP